MATKRVDMTYNRASQLAGLTRYGSISAASPVASTTNGYDTAGRLTSIAHTATASGSTFSQTHAYGYDDAGRMNTFSSSYGGNSATYEYTWNEQLASENHTGSTNDRNYTYDLNGNRTSVHGTAYVNDVFNRLTSDGTHAYQYDDEGNVTRKTKISDNTYTLYAWDRRNRLLSATDFTSANVQLRSVSYQYDAFNQMTGRTETVGSTTTRTTFAYRDGQVVLQFDEASSSAPTASDLSHRFLWSDAVDMLLADEQVNSLSNAASNDVLWALTDHQGSVRDMVDGNGKLRLHRNFDAFGNVIAQTHYNASGGTVTSGQTGYLDEAFAYTGRWFDRATGLQNNLNRWYNPKTGRWMSEDPIGFEGGDANLYRYVGNAPTQKTDPSGLILGFGGTWSDYWYYLRNPDRMDGDLRTCNKVAMGAIGASAGGLTGIGAGAMVGGGLTGGIVGSSVGGSVGRAIGGSRDGGATGRLIGGAAGAAAGGWGGARACPPAAPSGPKPPGWNDNWQSLPSSRDQGGWHWFDDKGGEWRFHDVDPWHPDPHWDHNPWNNWNSPWENIPL